MRFFAREVKKAIRFLQGYCLHQWNSKTTMLFNLSYDGGGGGGPYVPQFFLFIFLLKISPPDQTLRPTCKFLILAIFYHAKKTIIKF